MVIQMISARWRRKTRCHRQSRSPTMRRPNSRSEIPRSRGRQRMRQATRRPSTSLSRSWTNRRHSACAPGGAGVQSAGAAVLRGARLSPRQPGCGLLRAARGRRRDGKNAGRDPLAGFFRVAPAEIGKRRDGVCGTSRMHARGRTVTHAPGDALQDRRQSEEIVSRVELAVGNAAVATGALATTIGVR